MVKDFGGVMREAAKRDEIEERDEVERAGAEANLTPDQRHAHTVGEMLRPDSKRSEHQSLVDSIHPPGDEAA